MRVFHFPLALLVAFCGAGLAEAASAPPAGSAPAVSLVAPADIFSGLGLASPQPGVGAPSANAGLVLMAQAASQANSPSYSGNPAVAPLKWVGLLVNPTPTSDNPNLSETCTGQFIKPNVILTAAHCIKNIQEKLNGPWYDLSKQYFILQYQNGEGSETFKTVCAGTSPLWALPSNYETLPADQKQIALLGAYEHDIAMVLVDGESPTGVIPYQLDWKGKRTTASRVGYTSDILDDRIIQVAPGIVFFADSIPMYSQSFPHLVVHWEPVTDLTYGSSGGGWIANPSSRQGPDTNVLIAVSSFSNKTYPGGEGAAYLTSAEFNPLLDYVSNGCKSAQ